MGAKEDLLRSIKNSKLANAFIKVNREDFLPQLLKKYAYDPNYIDKPFYVTPNITTTALSLGIYILDILNLEENQKVLEIGTGIGYYTALIAEVVGENNIVSIEIDDTMFEYAKNVLLIRYPLIKLLKTDGSLGYEKEAPYDRIVVWAAAPTIPCKLYDQLKENGIMVVPIGGEKAQGLYRITKTGYEPKIERIGDVIFMKMRGLFGFYDNDDPNERRIKKLEEKVNRLLSKFMNQN
ncbi:protein-L-isoaspartate O-methyltransferase family protein [Saccharolobus islandicus]|jgi:protein-L-isoaspartate(D-aspartate) O-methyltransferase|uniref:protein-L-isoaspartate O-methyltransferase family protein n=1 Tax=Saccharolobus islandicus TaxID=43080 RepID=UPI00241F0017|nr:protein-L-isoaspartate O-methyltransferase [Sulfolobus islandicus]